MGGRRVVEEQVVVVFRLGCVSGSTIHLRHFELRVRRPPRPSICLLGRTGCELEVRERVSQVALVEEQTSVAPPPKRALVIVRDSLRPLRRCICVVVLVLVALRKSRVGLESSRLQSEGSL